MANPSPRLENLRPPWQPGTSGNPAGYSRGRRISDVIKTEIDELGLTEEFAASAIATALGYKQILKKNVQDPETGKDIWVELKPDLAWFKLILKIIEPPAQKPDDMAVLNALRAEYDRERRAEAEKGNASVVPERWWCDPVHREEKVESAGKLFQGVTACGGSGQVALMVPQTVPYAVDAVTNLAVKRRFDLHRMPILCGILALFHPARHAVQFLAFLETHLAGLFTGGIRRFLPGNIRIRPRLGRGLSGVLAAIAVVAFFQVNGQLLPDQLPPNPAAVEVAIGQADHHPQTLLARPTLSVLAPVLAPKAAPDGLPVQVTVRQADDQPQTWLTRPTLSVLVPVLAPKGAPAGLPIAGT
jgi:hypothetical protein